MKIGQEKETNIGSIRTILPVMDILLNILKKTRESIKAKQTSFTEAVNTA